MDRSGSNQNAPFPSWTSEPYNKMKYLSSSVFLFLFVCLFVFSPGYMTSPLKRQASYPQGKARPWTLGNHSPLFTRSTVEVSLKHLAFPLQSSQQRILTGNVLFACFRSHSKNKDTYEQYETSYSTKNPQRKSLLIEHWKKVMLAIFRDFLLLGAWAWPMKCVQGQKVWKTQNLYIFFYNVRL